MGRSPVLAIQEGVGHLALAAGIRWMVLGIHKLAPLSGDTDMRGRFTT